MGLSFFRLKNDFKRGDKNGLSCFKQGGNGFTAGQPLAFG
jgi:hypothetical protein